MAQIIELAQMPPLVVEFARYKQVIQGCSPRTVNEYLFDLRTFFRYLRAAELGIDPASEDFLAIDIRDYSLDEIAAITTEQIYAFLMYTSDVRANLWAAKARKLSALKAFFKYLTTKRGLLEKNPAIDIESPKPKKSLPKVMSLDESLTLLQTIAADTESPTRVRDYAIVTLFLNCGMRLSELVGINLNDVDRELRSMRVLGKGAKERIIYLNDACRDAILAYLPLRLPPDCKAKPTPALFLSSRHQRISVKTVQWMVQKYLAMAGLESRHYSVHKLRHTAATLMYQSGQVDVRVLKDILGHEQLNTTQIYTHISDAQMEDAMRQNPLSSVKAKPRQKPLSRDEDVESEEK
ncbi:MAG: tyrosine recombinase XerC [Clostridia bacterium]|nr:tyrosine recombinase XerC [Clostridia bacterium]